MSRRRSRAFTLVELLIVVAILALLLTLLMPALQRAKELARDAICKTNLRSIFIAFRLYSEDHEGWLPAVCYYDSGGAPNASGWKPYWETWNNFLGQSRDNRYGWAPKADYADEGVFVCPSYEWEVSYRGCYGFNAVMSAYEDKEMSWTKRDPAWPAHYADNRAGWNYHLPSTFMPGDMYLAGDTQGPGPGHGHQYVFRRIGQGTVHFRHLGHANVLFHDQHVEGLGKREVAYERWHRMPWWNRETLDQ